MNNPQTNLITNAICRDSELFNQSVAIAEQIAEQDVEYDIEEYRDYRPMIDFVREHLVQATDNWLIDALVKEALRHVDWAAVCRIVQREWLGS